MVVTVPLRALGSAFLWFFIIGIPLALLGQLIMEWRFALFVAALFTFAAVLARALAGAFDAYYRRQPGTVQYRLQRVYEAAYERELAVQAELGDTGGNARWAAKQAAKKAVEADRKLIADENVEDRAAAQQAKLDRAVAAASETARRRAAAEARVAGR